LTKYRCDDGQLIESYEVWKFLPEMEAGAILSLPAGNGLELEESAVEVEGSRH
jgi:hypothetical protein